MINHITIKNFRSISSLEVDLNHGNLIIEPNGTGKTNVLEALYTSVFGKSFRPVHHTSEFIQYNSDIAKIEIKADHNELLFVLSNTHSRISRKAKLNGKSVSSSKLPPKFPFVLFAPQTVDLVAGQPSIRRNDLDAFLSTISPTYSRAVNRYTKVLRNRNAVLKMIQAEKASKDELNYWTNELITLAHVIYTFRIQFFEDIDTFIKQVAEDLFHDFINFSTVYLPNVVGDKDTFREVLEKKFSENQQKEIFVGKTLYGVHKDDYSLFLNSKEVRYHASRGQQRISSLLIKLAQVFYIQKKEGTTITFLIDDIMSELDVVHRSNIAEYLVNNPNQFIITGHDINELPKELIKSSQRIHLT